MKSSPQSWDDKDDRLLVQLKEIHHLGWKQIANYFDNRTSNACQFRWRRLKSGQLKKAAKISKLVSTSTITITPPASPSYAITPWTGDEDSLIRSRLSKNLSLVELSILLPHRSRSDITSRISYLQSSSSSSSSSFSTRRVSIASLLTYDININQSSNNASPSPSPSPPSSSSHP